MPPNKTGRPRTGRKEGAYFQKLVTKVVQDITEGVRDTAITATLGILPKWALRAILEALGVSTASSHSRNVTRKTLLERIIREYYKDKKVD